MKKTIVLVGHCGPDSWALKSAIGSAVPGAVVASADSMDELDAALPEADLLLVNRVLGSAFGGLGGVELIREVHARGGPRTMLISNYADAQREAAEAGALAGFGKSELYAESTRSKLREAVGGQGPVDSTRI